jgi:hypothetical protein
MHFCISLLHDPAKEQKEVIMPLKQKQTRDKEPVFGLWWETFPASPSRLFFQHPYTKHLHFVHRCLIEARIRPTAITDDRSADEHISFVIDTLEPTGNTQDK